MGTTPLKDDSREWEDLWRRMSNRALERCGLAPVHVVKPGPPVQIPIENIMSLFTGHRELSIVAAANELGSQYSTVDKRLRKLEQDGKLRSRRAGRPRLYRLS